MQLGRPRREGNGRGYTTWPDHQPTADGTGSLRLRGALRSVPGSAVQWAWEQVRRWGDDWVRCLRASSIDIDVLGASQCVQGPVPAGPGPMAGPGRLGDARDGGLPVRPGLRRLRHLPLHPAGRTAAGCRGHPHHQGVCLKIWMSFPTNNNLKKKKTLLTCYNCPLSLFFCRIWCLFLSKTVRISDFPTRSFSFSGIFFLLALINGCVLKCNLLSPGHYDARSRVLIRHVGCLLRVCPQQLEEFEETLVEKLQGGGEESEWVSWMGWMRILVSTLFFILGHS